MRTGRAGPGLLLALLLGCGGSREMGVEAPGTAEASQPASCRVVARNQTFRSLMLSYYRPGGSNGLPLGVLDAGGSSSFAVPCALGSVRILGRLPEPGDRYVVASAYVRLEPGRVGRAVLRERR